MNKAIMLPINPQYCELIANGKQTVLLIKRLPKIDTPCKVYMYCMKKEFAWHCDTPINGNPHGKVFGEFVCNKILDGKNNVKTWVYISEGCGLSCSELYKFCGYDKDGEINYCGGLNITELKIYDKPKELGEFRKICNGCDFPYIGFPNVAPPCENCGKTKIKYPPQSWCYVEGVSE